MLNIDKEPLGAEQAPCGGWLVTRLRTAARGTLNLPGWTFSVGPRGGIGEHGDTVSRQLILSRVSLIERRPENYEVRTDLIKHFIFALLIKRVKTI